MTDKIFTVPFIKGISVTVPEERVDLRTLTFADVDIEKIIKTTGIESVRQSPNDKTISDYCINAAENLFEELNFDKSEIDGIVFSTYTGDYLSPGSGYIVQSALNLSSDCIVIDINQACAGYVYGLFQAFLMIQSGYCKNVLLCVGDTMTKMIHPKDRAERMILGDAGSASIISVADTAQKSIFAFHNVGKNFQVLYIPAGGRKLPIKTGVTDIEKTDEDGNTRTLENLYMDGLELMTFVMYAAPKTVKKVLNMAKLTKDDADLFVFHQANKTIVNSLGRVLRLPAEKVPLHVQEYGNTASASIPLALCLEKNQRDVSMENAVLCGFGGGLTCAAVALSLQNTHFAAIHEL